jgi:hypothetical protein
MARGDVRPPRQWTAAAAFGGILLGVAVALWFALHTVNSSQADTEGCGQPALSVILSGEGSNELGGNPRRGYRSVESPCYHEAEIDVFIAAAALVAPFAVIGLTIFIERGDTSSEQLRRERFRRRPR